MFPVVVLVVTLVVWQLLRSARRARTPVATRREGEPHPAASALALVAAPSRDAATTPKLCPGRVAACVGHRMGSDLKGDESAAGTQPVRFAPGTAAGDVRQGGAFSSNGCGYHVLSDGKAGGGASSSVLSSGSGGGYAENRDRFSDKPGPPAPDGVCCASGDASAPDRQLDTGSSEPATPQCMVCDAHPIPRDGNQSDRIGPVTPSSAAEATSNLPGRESRICPTLSTSFPKGPETAHQSTSQLGFDALAAAAPSPPSPPLDKAPPTPPASPPRALRLDEQLDEHLAEVAADPLDGARMDAHRTRTAHEARQQGRLLEGHRPGASQLPSGTHADPEQQPRHQLQPLQPPQAQPQTLLIGKTTLVGSGIRPQPQPQPLSQTHPGSRTTQPPPRSLARAANVLQRWVANREGVVHLSRFAAAGNMELLASSSQPHAQDVRLLLLSAGSTMEMVGADSTGTGSIYSSGSSLGSVGSSGSSRGCGGSVLSVGGVTDSGSNCSGAFADSEVVHQGRLLREPLQSQLRAQQLPPLPPSQSPPDLLPQRHQPSAGLGAPSQAFPQFSTRYVRRTRIIRTAVKIHGVEAEQVTAGWQGRVAQVVLEAGLQLEAAYVRSGCCELVVDAIMWADPAPPPPPSQSSPPSQPHPQPHQNLRESRAPADTGALRTHIPPMAALPVAPAAVPGPVLVAAAPADAPVAAPVAEGAVVEAAAAVHVTPPERLAEELAALTSSGLGTPSLRSLSRPFTDTGSDVDFAERAVSVAGGVVPAATLLHGGGAGVQTLESGSTGIGPRPVSGPSACCGGAREYVVAVKGGAGGKGYGGGGSRSVSFDASSGGGSSDSQPSIDIGALIRALELPSEGTVEYEMSYVLDEEEAGACGLSVGCNSAAGGAGDGGGAGAATAAAAAAPAAAAASGGLVDDGMMYDTHGIVMFPDTVPTAAAAAAVAAEYEDDAAGGDRLPFPMRHPPRPTPQPQPQLQSQPLLPAHAAVQQPSSVMPYEYDDPGDLAGPDNHTLVLDADYGACIIIGVRPRVLLMPRTPPPLPLQHLAGGLASAAAAAPRLLVDVWRLGGAAGPGHQPQIIVRSQGVCLPLLVSWIGTASGDAFGDSVNLTGFVNGVSVGAPSNTPQEGPAAAVPAPQRVVGRGAGPAAPAAATAANGANSSSPTMAAATAATPEDDISATFSTADVRLMGLPSLPGLLLVEARQGEQVRGTVVPVLLLSDPRVCRELRDLADRWQGTPGELRDVLMDLGCFVHHVEAVLRNLAAAAAAPVQPHLAHRPGSAAPHPQPPAAPAWPSPLPSPSPGSSPSPYPLTSQLRSRLFDLGHHLLSWFVEGSGFGAGLMEWPETIRWIQTSLAAISVAPVEDEPPHPGAAAAAAAGNVAPFPAETPPPAPPPPPQAAASEMVRGGEALTQHRGLLRGVVASVGGAALGRGWAAGAVQSVRAVLPAVQWLNLGGFRRSGLARAASWRLPLLVRLAGSGWAGRRVTPEKPAGEMEARARWWWRWLEAATMAAFRRGRAGGDVDPKHHPKKLWWRLWWQQPGAGHADADEEEEEERYQVLVAEYSASQMHKLYLLLVTFYAAIFIRAWAEQAAIAAGYSARLEATATASSNPSTHNNIPSASDNLCLTTSDHTSAATTTSSPDALLVCGLHPSATTSIITTSASASAPGPAPWVPSVAVQLLPSLVAVLPALLTFLSWPLLPRRAWVHLVRACMLPRLVLHLAAGALVAGLRLAQSRSVSAYHLGPAVLVGDGLLYLGTALVPVRSSALLGLLRVPVYVWMWHAMGADFSPLYAWARAALVSGVAVATNAACHAYLRNLHRSRRRQKDIIAAAAAAVAVAEEPATAAIAAATMMEVWAGYEARGSEGAEERWGSARGSAEEARE